MCWHGNTGQGPRIDANFSVLVRLSQRSGSQSPGDRGRREISGAVGPYESELRGRSMLVNRARMFPAECVVRGYLSGSGWKDYTRTGQDLRHCSAAGFARIGAFAGTDFHSCDQEHERRARREYFFRPDGSARRREPCRGTAPAEPRDICQGGGSCAAAGIDSCRYQV